MDKEKVLLTPNEAWDEREKWSKAMGQCTQDEFIPFDTWRDAAQCRKLLSLLKEPCTEREHYLNADAFNAFNGGYRMARKKCPGCMARVEEILK